MPLDTSKLKKLYSTLQNGGYSQSYAEFEKGFTGNDHYANRKQVYDLLTQHGADIGSSYEDFMKRMQTSGGAAQQRPTQRQTSKPAQQPARNQTSAGTAGTAGRPSTKPAYDMNFGGMSPGLIPTARHDDGNHVDGKYDPIEAGRRRWRAAQRNNPSVRSQAAQGNPHAVHAVGEGNKANLEIIGEEALARQKDTGEKPLEQVANDSALAIDPEKSGKRWQQRLDQLEYFNATGKPLENPLEIGTEITDDGEVVGNPLYAPTLARDDQGNILTGDNGEPLIGSTGDVERTSAYRQTLVDRQKPTIDEKIKEAEAEQARLTELLNRRGSELDAENLDFSWRDMPRGGGASIHTINSVDVNGRFTDTEYMQLYAALKKNEERLRDLRAARDERTGTFLGGLMRGMNDYVFDISNWDGGYRDMLTEAARMRSKGGFSTTEREKESERALQEEEYKSGEAAQDLEKVVGNGYRWSRITGQSLAFMMQFMAGNAMGMTQGISRVGESLGVSLARKIGIRQGSKNILRNMGRTVLKNTGVALGDLGAASALSATLQAPSTLSDIANRYVGELTYDPSTGDYKYEGGKSLGRSIYEGVANSTIENYTEMLGEHIHLGKFASSALTKMGLGRVSDWFTKVGKSDFMQGVSKYMEMGGFNGYPQEVLEEEIGIPLHALFDGGNEFSDLLDGRQQLDIVGGMLFSMAGMGAGSMIINGAQKAGMARLYHQDQHKLDNADKVASFRLTADRWNPIKERIDNTTNEDFGEVMSDILTNSDLHEQEQEAVWDYAQKLIIMRGHNMGQDASVRNGMSDRETDAANESFTEGYNTVDPTAMNDAKNGVVVAQQELDDIFGVHADAQQILDARDEDGTPTFSANARAKAQAVVNAQQQYEGMLQRVRDDIDDEVQQTSVIYDQRTNPTTGMIQSATLKAQNPDGTDRKVYITSGNVVLMDDGQTVDRQKSDMSIVVVDDEGKVEMLSPEQIFSLDTPINGEQAKQEAIAAIQQQRQQEAEAKINGKVQLVNGTQYTVVDDEGQQASVTIVADLQTGEVQNADGSVNVELNGQPVTMSVDDLQRWVDNANEGSPTPALPNEGGSQPTVPEPRDYAVNDTLVLTADDGIPTTAQVLDITPDGVQIRTDSPVNGRRMQVIPQEQLDGMVQLVNGEAVAQQQPTQPVGNNGAENIQQEDVNADEQGNYATVDNGNNGGENIPQRAIDRIPSQEVDDGKGNVRTVHQWEQAEPGDTYDALSEIYHGNADRVKKGVENRISGIDKQVKAVQKQMDAIDNSDDFDAVAAQAAQYDALQSQKEQLEAQKKYWQSVQGVPVARRMEADRKSAEEEAAAQQRRTQQEAAAAEQARQEREQTNGVPDVINDTPSDARERGFRNVNGTVVNRQEPTEGVTGRESKVKFSSNDTAKGRVKVIEAEQLQPSHVNGQRNPSFFIDEAQPKDRTDAVSSMAAAKIASSLNPEEITGDGSAYQFSSPTVNSRGEVIQGNNRSDALKLMWSTPAFKPAQDAYKQYIADHAEDFGFTPEDVEKIMQMQHPVMVNELDVNDAEAIRLGQMRASDNESGGIERIDPVTTSQKLGGKVGNFASVLLSSSDEDASLSDVLMQNGTKAVKWLRTQGVISDTAAQSAFDRKGNLTPEARMDLQNILKQSLFQGGVSDLPTMFDRMPAKAQKAILSTFMRDFDSAESERILPEIQKAIEAWYGCANANEAFAKASNYKAAKAAMHDWTLQTNLLDSNMPSDNFSNFAMELACRLQGCTMRETQQNLNDFFDLVQGKSQGDLFGGTTAGEQADRHEAIRRIFGIDYKPAVAQQRRTQQINDNSNGETGSNAVADDNSQSGEGRQGSPGDGASRERAETAGGSAAAGGRAESNDEEVNPSSGAASLTPPLPEREESQSAQPIVATSSSEKVEAERRPSVRLRAEQAERLLTSMEAQAEDAPEIELTPQAWRDVFDENNTTDTPIGRVKMGDGQVTKFFVKGRTKEFGMVGPTLHNPDVIIEEPSESKDGKSERGSSFVFVKTFNRNGEKIKFYASITVKQDGMEVSVSSHYMNKNAVSKKMQESGVFYIREALLPNSSEWHLAEHQNGVPDLLPTQGSDALNGNGKGTQSSSKKQEKGKKKNAGQFGLVSDERMEELKKRLRSKLNNLNMGVDPEVLAIGLELTAGYIDRGVKKFADYAKAMIADLGDVVRPYLKAFYNGVRDMPEITSNGLDADMDDYDTVSRFNVATIGKNGEEAKPSILDTAEQVSNEQTVQRNANNVSNEEVEKAQSKERAEMHEVDVNRLFNDLKAGRPSASLNEYFKDNSVDDQEKAAHDNFLRQLKSYHPDLKDEETVKMLQGALRLREQWIDELAEMLRRGTNNGTVNGVYRTGVNVPYSLAKFFGERKALQEVLGIDLSVKEPKRTGQSGTASGSAQNQSGEPAWYYVNVGKNGRLSYNVRTYTESRTITKREWDEAVAKGASHDSEQTIKDKQDEEEYLDFAQRYEIPDELSQIDRIISNAKTRKNGVNVKDWERIRELIADRADRQRRLSQARRMEDAYFQFQNNMRNSLVQAAQETGHLVVGSVPKTDEKKEQPRYGSHGYTLRKATQHDIENNAPVYVNGQRHSIIMVIKKGEQVGAAQFSAPVIDGVYLENNERVKLEQLEVEDIPSIIRLKTVGDFYEAYGNDAVALGQCTGVTVTQRKDGQKMAGFPKRAFDEYEQNMLDADFNVSVDGKLTDKTIAAEKAATQGTDVKAATQRIKEMLQGGGKKTSTSGKKKTEKGKKSQKKSVSSQQKQPSFFGSLFGDEESDTAQQRPTEQEPDLFSQQEQEPVVFTTDDEQGKEKPVETKPEKELSGDSKEYQKRAKAEKEFVERIKGMITDAADAGKSLTMTDIKAAYNDELDYSWELPDDYSATDLQELVERAMTLATREASISAISKNTPEEVRKGYDRVVKLYQAQPSLNARDSTRVEHQQYSTPTPFGYLMDWFLRNGNRCISGLEPSAGNGALTIGFPAALWHVNDIDERRLMNLRSMPYREITNQDGTLPFKPKAYDMVATNPPFGTTDEKEFDGGRTKINSLEGLMAINALQSMKDNGRAAIIIGGNTEYATNGMMKPKDMKLFRHLYTHYNVVDVINVDGDMYKRNGTGYNVRIILIAGRKTDVSDNPEKLTIPPVQKKARAGQVKSFDELYNRIEDDIQQAKQMGRQSAVAVNREASNGGQRTADSTVNHQTGDGTTERPVRTGTSERGTQSGRSDRPSTTRNTGSDGEREQPARTGSVDNGNGRNAGGIDAVPQRRPEERRAGERGDSGATGRGTVGGNVSGGTAERTDTNGERPTVEAAAQQQPTQPSAQRQKVELGQEKVAYPNKSRSMTLQSRVPAAQAEAIAENLDKLGDVDEMVRSELGYSSKDELFSHLAAEQIDSVALAIDQMKQGKGFIIGDMTGVGKGRQGAALIRWAIRQGKTPIYFTQKARLFTDNYRDMCDIGSKDLRPFIIASNKDGQIVEEVLDDEGNKTYDENGNIKTRVVHGIPTKKEYQRVYDYVLQNGKLPKEYDYVLVTYSQVANGTNVYELDANGNIKAKGKNYKGKKTPAADTNGDIRRDVLDRLVYDNYVILDESHTVGGQSTSGLYMQSMLRDAAGVTYLSATFAKRPDNMPLYAMKTAMSESGLSQKDMIEAIEKGGVTLQEVMSKQLVQSGQMIRRERDFTGVSIDWEGVDEATDKKQRAQFDEVAKIFNAIREFQDTYVDPTIEEMSAAMAEEGREAKKTQGTSHMGVNNVPFASKMYNLVNQLLFALKADAVADKTIELLKTGKYKPVISFANTMEGFLGELPRNTPMDKLPDFSLTLMRALEGTLRYTEGDPTDRDTMQNRSLSLKDLGDEALDKYNEIRKTILELSNDLPIDPMDAIKMRIEAAGYKVGEITGRTLEMTQNADGQYIVQSRQERDSKAAASAFNNGGMDVLLINKSGSTGISLHASTKFGDQRQRVMIAAQFQSDINDEVQMRGRIDRTGQVFRGRYIYLVSSIPAEQRLQMMFKNKLKSLDANTTSSQKSKFNEMEVTDFMNKYGDEVTWNYMLEHLDLEERLGDPLKILTDESKKDSNNSRGNDESSPKTGCAAKILRRLPFLSVAEQETIFKEISEAYSVKMQLLNDAGENDLEITTMPLRAKTIQKKIWKQGSDPESGNAFADNTYLEQAEVDVLKKPMKADEVRAYADRLTDGKPWEQWKQERKEDMDKFFEEKKKALRDKAEESAKKRSAKVREDYIKGCLKARKQGNNNWSDEEIGHMADIAVKEFMDKEKEKVDGRVAKIDAQIETINETFDFFTPLESYIVPLNLSDSGATIIPSLGTFLGIKFNKNYSTASSTALFATLDGRRKVELPLNDKTSLGNIRRQSVMLSYQARGLNMDNWNSKVPTKSRRTAYIVTGNLMQALVDTQKDPTTKGQLISYTTMDGDVRQGILMNDRFKEDNLKASVPISTRYVDIVNGDTVESNDNEVKIERGTSYHYNDFKLSVPKSKAKGGKYFLDKGLLKFIEGGDFTTIGGNMVGWIAEHDLKKALDYLSKRLGVTVDVKADLKETDIDDSPTTPSEAEEGDVLYREVDDEEAARLDAEPTVKVYRAMQQHDGKLYPPMSGRVREQYTTKKGTVRNRWTWRTPTELGRWEQSEEHPERANEDGTFTLDKGNGSTIDAAYNPYIHTSRTPINDQFSSAWSRPELVTVEVEVPLSELTSGYKAEKAKDSVGEVAWHAGPVSSEMAKQGNPRLVILSRWDKPVRIVPIDEVADEYARRLAGTGIAVPFNTVPPALRDALAARGVEIGEPERGNAGQASRPSYEEWLRGNTRQRDGQGAYSDEELSLIHDPAARLLGAAAEQQRTQREQRAFAGRERERMAAAVNEMAAKLHLDNVEASPVPSNGRGGRRARAKGYYDKSSGKIVINIVNHRDIEDVMQTLLHEAVAHYGLRQLFGEHFDTFLDNVYKAANMEVRRRIAELALRKYKGDFHTATEEYLASLAEDTDFERMPHGFWQTIKRLFLELLHSIGFDGFAEQARMYGLELSDNELRYILWRSYENLREPGRYRSILGEAEDVAKQAELQVGNYADAKRERDLRHAYNAYDEAVINYQQYEAKKEDTPLSYNPKTAQVYKEAVDYWQQEIRNIEAQSQQALRQQKAEAQPQRTKPKASEGVAEELPERAEEIRRMKAIPISQHDTSREYVREQYNKLGTATNKRDGKRVRFYHGVFGKMWRGTDSLFAKVAPQLKELFEDSIYGFSSEENLSGVKRPDGTTHKEHRNIRQYDYYVGKANINGRDYYVRFTIEDEETQGAGVHHVMVTDVAIYENPIEDASAPTMRGGRLVSNGIKSDAKLMHLFGIDVNNSEKVEEPRVWGKKDLLSKAEQVTEGIDPDLLFRDTIEDRDNTARETYNAWAESALTTLREAWQDSMINVRNLQDAVLKQENTSSDPLISRGGTNVIADYEDAYNEENRSHGRSRAESEYFTDNLYKPLLKAVNALAKAARVTPGDVTEYMMCKHGLERNIVFAQRDAQREYDKAYDEAKSRYDALMDASRAESDPKKADALKKRADKVKFPDYDEIYQHFRQRDYSGLTSLTGQADVLDAESEAGRIVADMEQRAAAQQQHTQQSLVDDLWQKVNDCTKWTLKKSYESGMMSKDNYENVRTMFSWYVPLRGWREDTAGDLYDYVGSGDRGTAFSPTLHKAKGRRSEADNPIAYIGSMAVSAIVQGNKNKVKQTFMGFVENHPTNLVTVSEMWYRNYGTSTDPDWREDVPYIPEDASADDIARIVEQHETMMEQLKDNGLATKERGRLHLGVPVKAGQALEHHVEVMVNGKKYVLYINGNPRAAQALNGTRARMSSEHSFESRKIAQAGRKLAERYTSLSPSFTVSNMFRDLTMAAITTLIKESPSYAIRFRLNVAKMGGPIGMFGLMRWYKKAAAQPQPTQHASTTERYFYEFMTEGAETGFTSLKEIEEYKKDMQKLYSRMNQSIVNPKRLFRGLAKGLEIANRCIEDMTRFAIYEASRQEGRSVRRSTTDAKNITLNFNRKGSGEKGNATYRNLQIFVNPAIQALQNVAKMAKEHPIRFSLLSGSIALIGAGQVFATMMLWSMFGGGDGDDDDWNAVDEYWKLPSWQRRNNLVFWVPGTQKFAMIPLAQEFRVFHGFGETLMTVVDGHSQESVPLELLTQASDLLPLDFAGNNGNILINAAPTVTQPLLQVGFNTDFTGRPLYKDNDFNKYEPSFQKAYVGTPSWLVKSSALINEMTGGNSHRQGLWERTKIGSEANNPAVVDHLLKGYYGGMYSFLAQLGGTMYTMMSGDLPDAQEVPILNRVITAPRENEQSGKVKLPDWYYDLSKENSRRQNEFNGYKKDYMTDSTSVDGRGFQDVIKRGDFEHWQQVNAYIGAVQQIRTAISYTQDAQEKAELKESLDEVLGELQKMSR